MHPQSLFSGRLVPSLVLAAILCALLADELVKVGARAAQADVAPRAVSAPQFVAPRLVPTLVRQPYLQRVSASSVTIVWAALEPGAGEVRYQSAGGNTVVVQAVTTLYTSAQTGMAHDYYQHEATLTGLSAATTYAYEVFVGGVDATAVTDEFTTAPPTGIGTTSFVVFGDSGSGTASQENLAKLIAAEFRTGQRDLAIHTGDIVYPKGSYQLFQDRFFAIYEEWLRRRPIFFALGNHEYYEADARPYLNLFVMPENGYNAQIPDHRERYYSFDYGPVHFISLDTNAFNGNLSRQQQLTWLVRDLEATTQPWRIVFMHIPTYGSSYFTNLRTTLQPIFERYGVQLVLAGHEHDYARGAPWREPPTAYSPVMHVVSGGGGASLNQPTPGPWLVNWARAFHYLNVTVTDCAPSSSCELTLDAIGLDGLRFDTFTLPLRAQQQDAAPPQVTWDQPEAGAVRSGIATISAIVSDDQQIVKVDALIDGVLRFVDDVPPYEWTWDTTKDLNGERTLELRAIDVAGHVTISEPRVVRVANAQPTVRLLSPLASESVFTGFPYRIRWAAEAGSNALAAFRVAVSADGKTFQSLAACDPLPSNARECLWNTPGPVSTRSAVRITVLDEAGAAVSHTSPAFRIQNGTPRLTVSFPNNAATLGLGSSPSLRWASNLGNVGTLKVDISRNGGASWDVVAPALLPLAGDLRWIVTGPLTTQGLLRINSLNMPLADTSNAHFTIAAPSLAVTSPKAAASWTVNTQARVTWKTNLGLYDRLNVRLSVDGGTTFPIVLAGSVAASAPSVTITVPAVTTQTARVMVESLQNPDWRATSSANFKIVAP